MPNLPDYFKNMSNAGGNGFGSQQTSSASAYGYQSELPSIRSFKRFTASAASFLVLAQHFVAFTATLLVLAPRRFRLRISLLNAAR